MRTSRGQLACGAVGALAFTVAGCHRSTARASSEPLMVAAAADLSSSFKDLGAAYEKRTGRPVVFSFGATGLLEKQIAEGAPFDVFAAANVSYADDAIRAGACQADSKALYATGHLVLYAPADAAFAPKTLGELVDDRVKKIAIANPDHAPYGLAARQAMQRAGVWDGVHTKVVYGENVQQAMQFAQSGNAEVAIVALSLAIVAPGSSSPIPMDLHDPIDQAMVACTGGRAGAEAGRSFIAFAQSADGRAVMRRFGFLLPGESLTPTPP